jgi:hypothetical protein
MNQLSLFDGNQDLQQGGDRPPTQNLAQPPPKKIAVEDSLQTSPTQSREASLEPTECYCGERIQISGLDAYKCPTCGWITWNTYRTKRGK